MGQSRKNNTLGCVAALCAVLIGLASGTVYADANDIRSSIEKDTRVFSIEVRDAEISDVLRALAQQSGFNIILGEGVEGKISLSFKNIAFKDALEVIIKANGLMYTIQNNVFWVGKKVDLSQEIAMDVVRLSYTDPATVINQLKGTLSANGAAFADPRTNSVILRDLPRNIADAKTLIKAIDKQTVQFQIEARIVEATSSFSRQLGVQWGGTYTTNNVITGSALLPLSNGGRHFAVNLPAPNATSGVGLVIGSLSRKLLLDLELSAAESKGELKIVSRPKISTLNNKPATIHSGLTFRVKLSTAVQLATGGTVTPAAVTAAPGTTTGVQEIRTGIDLTVTPQITADDFIQLNINTNKSDPDFTHTVDGIPGVTEKSASTNVLVRDGDTLVIGGLYKSIASEQEDSVPFLSRIPVLGWLFKNQNKNLQDEELLVFITPKIMKFEPQEVKN